MNALAGRGLMVMTDEVAAGIALERGLEILDALRSAVVETDLGPAVLLREVERVAGIRPGDRS